LFSALDAEFHFTLDVCASEWNAKCARYFTEQDDGLQQDYGTNICFMNSPYGKALNNWMRKAFEASLLGATVVCLVPVSTDRPWWTDYAMKGEIRYLPGRPNFLNREGEWQQLMRPSAIVIFRPPGATSATEPKAEPRSPDLATHVRNVIATSIARHAAREGNPMTIHQHLDLDGMMEQPRRGNTYRAIWRAITPGMSSQRHHHHLGTTYIVGRMEE